MSLESLAPQSIARIMLYMDYNSLKLVCLSTHRLSEICCKYKIYECRNQGVLYWNGVRVNVPSILSMQNTKTDFFMLAPDGAVYQSAEADPAMSLPMRVSSLSKVFVTSISCGDEFAIFTCITGHSYGLGNGTWGVFGDGNRETQYLVEPARVYADISVQSVTCVCHSTIILSRTGQVYMCGLCYFLNQDLIEIVTPMLITVGMENEYVISIDYTERCMIAFVTNRGAVYVCGDEMENLLGFPASIPTHVNALINYRIARVKAFEFGVYFVCTQGNSVFYVSKASGIFETLHFPERIVNITGFNEPFFISENYDVYSSLCIRRPHRAAYMDEFRTITPIVSPPPPTI